jgi:DNA mismatch repair protein MSH6
MLNMLPDVREAVVGTFTRLPDLERMISRVHAGRCKVKDFVRVLEAFQGIMQGIEEVRSQCDVPQETLLGKLLSSFDGLKDLLHGWENVFDWNKAKEEGPPD